MDLVTVSSGVVIIMYGVFTLALRVKAPEKFAKLEAMRDKFGHGVGTAIHTTAYSVLPVLLGGLMVRAGVNGVSLMQFFAA